MRTSGRILIVAAAFAIIAILGADSAFGQGMKWRGSGGWGPGGQYGRMYDPKTVETVSGEVLRVERIAMMKGMAAGVHITLKTDKEAIAVHLGPVWYLENQDVKIQPKDKVEVTGSRITFAGKPALIAAEVKKGDETLRLRDEAGFPVWSGWRRR
jgi:hypothetical protein